MPAQLALRLPAVVTQRSKSRVPNVAESNARQWASDFGVPLAYLYADNSDLAEVILAFGLLSEREQRRLALELKARVSTPAMKPHPVRCAQAARHRR